MATEVKLPRLGQGMESGVIVRWLKAPGEQVRKGEPLYELDTDKVTQEVEAEADGLLREILIGEGEVAVGTIVALIDGADGEPGAEPVTEANGGRQSSVPEATPPQDVEPAATPQPEPRPTPPAAEPTTGRTKASPLARRIARERGIDLASVVPTGPEGRILAQDVEQTAVDVVTPVTPSPGTAGTEPVGPVEVVPLTTIRKTIARRLTEAWTAPVFQLGVAADMTHVLSLREALVAGLHEGDPKPTVNDVLVKLAATALVRHTAVNATFAADEIHRFSSANVGIAVAAPQGLVVPVIKAADRATVAEISRVRADLVARARDGKLTLADMDGGTFTISNLGMFGVEQFTAVINPPQVAILAVGAVKEQVVVLDGETTVAPILHLSLTCDHRAIDGADGARFLQTLVALIEQPALAL